MSKGESKKSVLEGDGEGLSSKRGKLTAQKLREEVSFSKAFTKYGVSGPEPQSPWEGPLPTPSL